MQGQQIFGTSPLLQYTLLAHGLIAVKFSSCMYQFLAIHILKYSWS